MSRPDTDVVPPGTPGLVAQRLAQIQGLRASVSGLPREALRCYPVPVLHEGEIFLGVPFCLRQGQPPAAPKIGAPGWVVYLDIATGSRASSRTMPGDPTVMLGEHRIEPPMTMVEFRQAEEAMLAAMDELLTLLRAPARGLSAETIAAKSRFVALWQRLAHKPIAEHYRALNPAWFASLGL